MKMAVVALNGHIVTNHHHERKTTRRCRSARAAVTHLTKQGYQVELLVPTEFRCLELIVVARATKGE